MPSYQFATSTLTLCNGFFLTVSTLLQLGQSLSIRPDVGEPFLCHRLTTLQEVDTTPITTWLARSNRQSASGGMRVAEFVTVTNGGGIIQEGDYVLKRHKDERIAEWAETYPETYPATLSDSGFVFKLKKVGEKKLK